MFIVTQNKRHSYNVERYDEILCDEGGAILLSRHSEKYIILGNYGEKGMDIYSEILVSLGNFDGVFYLPKE